MINIIDNFRHPRRFLRESKLRKKGINPTDFSNYNQQWLVNRHFDIILDIGAARGSHTMLFLELFPNALVHAFEPIPESYQKLSIRLAGNNRAVIHNVALADKDGSTVLNVSPYLDASSVLAMAQEHKLIYPGSAYTHQIEVQVKTLDSVIKIDSKKKIFIKIDVQGAESLVVSGGERVFRQTEVVIAEVSFRVLYEGSPTFLDFCNIMKSLGLHFNGFMDQTRDREGLFVQGDAIFCR